MTDFIQTQLPFLLFLGFCALTVFCALGVVVLKNPVSSAFSLVLVLLNVAGIFAMQEAYFVSVVQVLVYAGAIMVLFIFVIMLLSIEYVESDWTVSKLYLPIPVVLASLFFAVMAFVFLKGTPTANPGQFTPAVVEQNGGNVRVISELMFSDYILPFLISGMLLSIVIVGAVLLAKRKVD